MSKQILPSLYIKVNITRVFQLKKSYKHHLSIFGWYNLVKKRTFGGPIGYSAGRNSSNLNNPPKMRAHTFSHIQKITHVNIEPIPWKGESIGPAIATVK